MTSSGHTEEWPPLLFAAEKGRPFIITVAKGTVPLGIRCTPSYVPLGVTRVPYGITSRPATSACDHTKP